MLHYYFFLRWLSRILFMTSCRRSTSLAIFIFIICFLFGATGCSGEYADGLNSIRYADTGAPDESEIQNTLENSKERAQQASDIITENRNNEFEEYKESVNSGENETADKDWVVVLLSWFYRYYEIIRMLAAPVSIMLMIAGIMIMIFARGNPKARQRALYGMIIGPSVLGVVIVYGIGYLNGIYLP